MATKGDSDSPERTDPPANRGATQPYGPRSDSTPPPPAATDESLTEKDYDPHRSGLNEYSTDLFKKLISAEVPLVPKEELFETRPPNVRFATPSPSEFGYPADPLPAVESPAKGSAISSQSKRTLALGALALLALGLALFFSGRNTDRTQATKPADTHVPARATEAVLPPLTSTLDPALAASVTPTPALAAQPIKTAPSGQVRAPRPPNRPSTPLHPKEPASAPEPPVAHPALGPRPE